MDKSFKVLLLNQISPVGLKRLPHERYVTGKSLADPDVILVRSQDMHSMTIPASVKAIGRAGAGTNNIPVAALSQRGVPVFNAPGANANAVKELVLAGMLMASRNLAQALKFTDGLIGAGDDFEHQVEEGKKQYAGFELTGHTLGVIGLGRIGCLVADTAIKLGMHVLGHDPDITVDAAWSLPSQVKKAHSIDEVLKNAHFVSLHVPLVAATRDLINEKNLEAVRAGAVLLNFSRDAIVSEAAVLAALAGHRLRMYVCDFPSPALRGHPQVVALPHLGASTREAEDNCAAMIADQVRDFLEDGNIRNAVNFPDAAMARESPYRVAIANANAPNMLGQISTTMARAGLNIHNMLNKSRGDMAFTLVDVDSAVSAKVIDELAAIEGVLAVRYLPVNKAA